MRNLQRRLRNHPDRPLVNKLIQGFTGGFCLCYTGPKVFRSPPNLVSAHQWPDLVLKRLHKEILAKRMAGPFKVPPFPDLICSPIGMVDKKDTDEKRMIMHLSFPTGGSINDFIDPVAMFY